MTFLPILPERSSRLLQAASFTIDETLFLMRTQPDIPFAKTTASVLLDLLRGVASVLVVSTHWRNLLFLDYAELQVHRRLLAPAYLLTSNGHRAVVVFFVLSGYLIGSSVLRTVERNTWHWPTYLLQRLVRLWVVLIPGLLLCAVWDRLGVWLGRAPAVYGGISGDHVVQDVALTSHLPTFLANMAFLQGIHAYVFGSNGPLWSLANEWWYYLLFPLGLFCLVPRAPWLSRVVNAAVFLAIALLVGKGMFLAFPLWLAGVALVWLPRAPDNVALRWGALVVLLLYFFCVPARLALGSDWCVAAITTATIWTFLGARQGCEAQSTFSRCSRALARMSFTLYVVHMPLLTLLTSVVQGDTRWQPSLRTISAALALLLLTLAYAWLVASLTEFHTERVRLFVAKRLGVTPVRPSLHAQVLETATTALK